MDTSWVVPNTSKVNRISSVQMLSVGHRGHKVGCTKYFKGQQDIKCPNAKCRAPWTQGGLYQILQRSTGYQVSKC